MLPPSEIRIIFLHECTDRGHDSGDSGTVTIKTGSCAFMNALMDLVEAGTLRQVIADIRMEIN